MDSAEAISIVDLADHIAGGCGNTVGHVIGKDGTNIAFLRKKSGARFHASFDRKCLQIGGSTRSSARALELLSSQIHQGVVAYAHPDKVQYVIKPDGASMVFACVTDPTGAAGRGVERSEGKYKLRLCWAPISEEHLVSPSNEAVELVSAWLQACEIDNIKGSVSQVGNAAAGALFQDRMVNSIVSVLNGHPNYPNQTTPKCIKIRANFGNQLFYRLRRQASPLDHKPFSTAGLQQLLQNHNTDDGIRPTFSNGLDMTTMIHLKALLQSHYRMKHVKDKMIASTHFVDKQQNTSLVISIDCQREKLCIRKVKSGSKKPHFITTVQCNDHLDHRIKVLCQMPLKQEKVDHATQHLQKLIDQQHVTKEALKRACLPPSPLPGYKVDSLRYKKKQLYELHYQEQIIKVTVSHITDLCQKPHYEVLCKTPALSTALGAISLAAHCGTPREDLEQEIYDGLSVLSNFCNEVSDKVMHAA